MSASNNTDFVDSITSGPPFKLITAKITITRRCNSRCRKCHFWRRRSQGEISFDNLIKIIDDLAGFGCEKLNLIGGETTLYERLFDVIAYANRRELKCTITSNGQLIDRDYAKGFKNVKIQNLFISLDSHKEDVHDYIVGINGAWRKTVNTIRLVREYIPKYVRHLAINHVLTAINYDMLPGFIKYAHSEGVKHIKVLPYENIDFKENDDEFSLRKNHVKVINDKIVPECLEISNMLGVESNLSRISNSIDNLDANFFARRNDLQVNTPCFYPFCRIDIDHLGNVYPCCSMKEEKYLMGNVLERGIGPIINGEKFKKFKQGLVPPIKYPECKRCWIAIDDNVETMKLLKGVDVIELLKNG